MFKRRHHRGPGTLPEHLYRLWGGGTWKSEPPALCVDDGVPSKLVRESLHGYGNAIVPEIAIRIFKRIKEIDNEYQH
jgi:hypothetical protein